MHQVNFDINLEEICKIEGDAGLEVKVRDGKVENVRFKIQEYKRFYTQGMRGKRAEMVPQFVARICGTCSNAHLLASIEAVEKALDIQVTEQTQMLKILMVNGLMIRDHALHLYLFALPDLFNVDSFLDFDENDPEQNQMLHDALAIKSVGNQLQVQTVGRSVHAPYAAVGGFTKTPEFNAKEMIEKLEGIRPAILRLIDVLMARKTTFHRDTTFAVIRGEKGWSFLEGKIIFSSGEVIEEVQFRDHLEHVVIPYSQASGYTYKGNSYLTGALARLNLNKDQLHARTKEDCREVLGFFPSTDVMLNNIAQAVETLHAIDESIDILTNFKFGEEKRVKPTKQDGVGVGVIEAPRGLLFYKFVIEKGIIREGQVVIPTGQNQMNIEQDIGKLVQDNLDMDRYKLEHEIEKLVRAYDPCMSCAAHFLKVKWDEK